MTLSRRNRSVRGSIATSQGGDYSRDLDFSELQSTECRYPQICRRNFHSVNRIVPFESSLAHCLALPPQVQESSSSTSTKVKPPRAGHLWPPGPLQTCFPALLFVHVGWLAPCHSALGGWSFVSHAGTSEVLPLAYCAVRCPILSTCAFVCYNARHPAIDSFADVSPSSRLSGLSRISCPQPQRPPSSQLL